MTATTERTQHANAPRKLRIAIAGLGVGATQTLPGIEHSSLVELVAAADVRADALRAFQDRYGGRTYGTVEDLANDPDVDAIFVSTPNHLHKEHVVTAAEHGKHVVVQKPMALSIEECEQMIEAAERNHVKLIAGHSLSSDPHIQAMRTLIASGELGRLTALNTWMFTDWLLRPRMPQEIDLSLGGGVVYRQGPHQVDAIRYLGGGMVRSVRAMVGEWMPARPCPGNYSAYLEFEDGTPATLVYSGYGYFDTSELTWGIGERNYHPDDRVKVRKALAQSAFDDTQAKEAMRFAGSREGEFAHGAGQEESTWRISSGGVPGAARFFGLTIASCERGDLRQSPTGVYVYDDEGQREIPVDRGSRGGSLQELYEAIVDEKPLGHDGYQGMAALEVCLAIMQSARERREIRLTRQRPTPT